MEQATRPQGPGKRLARLVLLLAVVGGGSVVGGCAQVVQRGYSPFVRDLDGRSELRITTYPAWIPRETVDIPFLYKKRVSPDSVYFQVFVREAGREGGTNPHVDSIRIESFSYRVGGGASTELISDYGAAFWMQDQPHSAQPGLDLSAVPYDPAWTVSVEIALLLNGERFSFEGEMPAEERTRTYPLILHRLR